MFGRDSSAFFSRFFVLFLKCSFDIWIAAHVVHFSSCGNAQLSDECYYKPQSRRLCLCIRGGRSFCFWCTWSSSCWCALGSSDGDLDGNGVSGSGIALAKIIKPQRVWALRRGLISAVRDVPIGVEGSLIVCTDSGHVLQFLKQLLVAFLRRIKAPVAVAEDRKSFLESHIFNVSLGYVLVVPEPLVR
ncbi:hypothetical protein BT96DRAFT_212224 [Gymnopus androsaceus JB14]|uniref:Uncharacterized protein n=1 Tax=Gymnopus androsaceus JB14 TaxID=1447944 RepID=A0A6A4H968_9AGAR|nr:hypothetical protein BT96DRAFT_212224 [Gymnopus androsaceus JB14]